MRGKRYFAPSFMINQITTCLHVVTGFFSSYLVIADTYALGYNIKKIKLFRTTEKKKS